MTTALAAATRQRSDQTRQRATQTLQRLHATGQPTTFAHIARTAGVSRSWLYHQPDLRAEINRLRQDTTTQTIPIPPAEQRSTQSQQQRLNAALDEITRLKTDNHQLRQHLAQHLGHQRQNRIATPSTTCPPHETPDQNHNNVKRYR